MKRLCFLLVAISILSSAIPAFALVGVECFSKTYTRLKGKPVVVSDHFTSALTTGRIILTNGDAADPSVKRVTAARVWLNGVQVFSPSDFNDNVTEITLDIGLIKGTESNTLDVQIKGPKDSTFTIKIVHDVEAAATSHLNIGYLPANQYNYLYWKPVPAAVSYKVYWGTNQV